MMVGTCIIKYLLFYNICWIIPIDGDLGSVSDIDLWSVHFFERLDVIELPQHKGAMY